MSNICKIPDYIKNVERPIHSEVKFVGGKYFVNLYSSKRGLKKRDGTIRTKPGKVTGPRIGVIELFDGEYIFRPNKYYANLMSGVVEEFITDKEHGGSKVLFDLMKPYMKDLELLFGKDTGMFLCLYAIMKLLCPNIKGYQLERKYMTSYISNLIRDVSLSKNTISKNLETIGLHPERFKDFMLSLMNDKNNLVIDGTLFATSTKSNSLVRIGRKDKGVYHNQLNLVYVYDYIKKIPVYYDVVSGNTNDLTAFKCIYNQLNLTDGIIIGDRMFGSPGMRNTLSRDGISYLFPLKKNDSSYERILNNNSLKTKRIYNDGTFYEVKYKRVSKTKYLTYFKDLDVASSKEKAYLDNMINKKAGYTSEEYESLKNSFGVCVFETNKKYKVEKIIELYKLRWSIEILNNEYMNELDLDEINVTGNYRASTMLFINHLSLMIYFRLKGILSNCKVPVMDFIDSLKDIRVVKERDTWKIRNLSIKERKRLDSLGLKISVV